MRRLRAVLFDLDGTLVDHVGAATAAVDGWLDGAGVAPDPAHAARWFEVENRHHARAISGELTWDEQRRERLRDFLPYVGLPAVEEQLDATFAVYYGHYVANWRGYPDAQPALLRAHDAGLAVGVLTNGTHLSQQAKLDAAGLTDVAGLLLASDRLGVGKPDPRVYAAALAALGTSADETLMVGDNHALDVVAARAAGLRAVHLDRPGSADAPDEHRVTTLDAVNFQSQC